MLDGKISYLLIFFLNILDNNQSILSIYAQLPQNIFVGLSELFATMASYEYAYFAAPRSAQALFMSLCFVSVGVSSFIGSIYINFFPNRDVAINFEVSQKLVDFLFSFLYSTDFSVYKSSKLAMEFLHLFLHSCRCSINFYYYSYFMSKKISNHQTES